MALRSHLHHLLGLLESVAGPKRRFIMFGAVNVLLTNLLLQLLLLTQPIWSATFASQVFNACMGFYLYGKGVFRVSRWRLRSFWLYGLLAIFLWLTNGTSLEFLTSWGIQENLAALLMIPFLALLSYGCQKYLVFSFKSSR